MLYLFLSLSTISRIYLLTYVLLLTGTTIYNLTAVLIHRGPSAFSGHYIAHIKTMPSAQWFRFNDELIEKLSDKKQLGVEDQDEGWPIRLLLPHVLIDF